MKHRRFTLLSGTLALLLVVASVGAFAYHQQAEYSLYHFDKTRNDPDAIFGGGEAEEAEHANLAATKSRTTTGRA